MVLNRLCHMIDQNVYITYMLGKVVPQPENQLGYPHFKPTSKSDLVTEGSAWKAEPKSDSYLGLGGTGPNSIFRLQLGHWNSFIFPLWYHHIPYSAPSHCMTVE